MTQQSEHHPTVLRFEFATADITALTWGDPTDPVAILVHGFPDSAWSWDRLGPAMAVEGRYVVAPFLRGYAPSSLARDDDYSLASLIGDVLDLYRAVGADRRTVLVGHDWGGAIVSATSACCPELFDRAVLIAIPPLAAVAGLFGFPLRERLGTLVRQLPRSWYMAVVSMPWVSERIGPALPALLWRLWAIGGAVDPYRRRGLIALDGRARRRAAYCYYRAVWNPRYRRARVFPARQRVAFGAMGNPTLYLHGRDDTCGLERTGAHALDFLPPGSARLVVEHAGHFAHLDQPDVIARHIADHIRSGATA
ncbi:alpha/beta hydrolase [Nocardia iowensis]|uniref:Alpha/beta hydrolase n=1 Tax=Nocardia iowensis TaxID=204891 RepID=A0ABX8RUB6_NOCIO|nr:alpha/beta hydrolase [Nocardia iowensis]QXN93228.1 alpha/beta hydrolase [Nocardia iowensis]